MHIYVCARICIKYYMHKCMVMHNYMVLYIPSDVYIIGLDHNQSNVHTIVNGSLQDHAIMA